MDVLYLHNPIESQLPSKGRDEVLSRLTAAFETLESLRITDGSGTGGIGSFGLATWSCFRVPPEGEDSQY